MSDTTRTHRPTTSSPRYTKAHGIGRDRVRWPAQLGTYRRGESATQVMLDRLAEKEDDAS